jgi:hypothetical protein
LHPEQEWTWSGSLELDAAIRLADLNAAANKLMRAKEALKRLEAQAAS